MDDQRHQRFPWYHWRQDQSGRSKAEAVEDRSMGGGLRPELVVYHCLILPSLRPAWRDKSKCGLGPAPAQSAQQLKGNFGGVLRGSSRPTSLQDAVMCLKLLHDKLCIRPPDCTTGEDHPAPFLHSAVASGDITDAAQFLSCQKIASAFPACTHNHYTHPRSTHTCSNKSR